MPLASVLKVEIPKLHFAGRPPNKTSEKQVAFAGAGARREGRTKQITPEWPNYNYCVSNESLRALELPDGKRCFLHTCCISMGKEGKCQYGPEGLSLVTTQATRCGAPGAPCLIARLGSSNRVRVADVYKSSGLVQTCYSVSPAHLWHLTNGESRFIKPRCVPRFPTKRKEAPF